MLHQSPAPLSLELPGAGVLQAWELADRGGTMMFPVSCHCPWLCRGRCYLKATGLLWQFVCSLCSGRVQAVQGWGMTRRDKDCRLEPSWLQILARLQGSEPWMGRAVCKLLGASPPMAIKAYYPRTQSRYHPLPSLGLSVGSPLSPSPNWLLTHKRANSVKMGSLSPSPSDGPRVLPDAHFQSWSK